MLLRALEKRYANASRAERAELFAFLASFGIDLDGRALTFQGDLLGLIDRHNLGRDPKRRCRQRAGAQGLYPSIRSVRPFATQTIPATVHEAPYILDGLLMNDAGRRVREQYADTGGFTDHVFAVTALLGYQFIPRIRDLPSKRLHVFDPGAVPNELRGLIGSKVRNGLIASNWPDLLRSAATMAAGTISPSQLLRKFASYPRQHDLAAALREIGRIERTLFIIDWVLDPDMRRRAQIGLNKGESHRALKNAIRIGRQGEIRDRSSEGQHYRMAGLNLLAAIVIYWNTVRLGEAVRQRKRAGLPVERSGFIMIPSLPHCKSIVSCCGFCAGGRFSTRSGRFVASITQGAPLQAWRAFRWIAPLRISRRTVFSFTDRCSAASSSFISFRSRISPSRYTGIRALSRDNLGEPL